MAASFEAVVFFSGCARTGGRRPSWIWGQDLVAIFRSPAATAEAPCQVTSLDASAAWLEKSRAYSLKTAGDDQGFFTWEAYAGREPFDLVFVDIDYTPNRPAYYDPVLTRFTKKGSLVVFDDMHSRILRAAFVECRGPHPHVEYDIKALTSTFSAGFFDHDSDGVIPPTPVLTCAEAGTISPTFSARAPAARIRRKCPPHRMTAVL
jgi:hypothetical protein